jgi:hypothetical protein
MKILWNNYLDSGSSYTPYSVDANYPVSNIYDSRLSRVYHTNGLASTEYIIIKETGSPQYVSLFNHNVSSSGTIYIEGGSSSLMSTVTWTQTLTWSSYQITSAITSTVSCTYFRLRITGISTATLSYISLGYMFLGDYLEMPGMRPDQTIFDETTSRITLSQGGQLYADDGYNFRSAKINFPYLTHAQRASIRSMWATIKNYKSVIMITWPSNSTYELPIYGVIDQKQLQFTRTDDPNMAWETSLTIREIF